jgi:predicted nucleic acid-binding protein
LSISVVTLGELYTWALRLSANPKRIQQLADLRVAMTLLDVDHDVAYTFGRLRATLLDLGQPVPATDLLIAATAITHDLTLVTGNIRDFASVPGLRITDWK